MKRLPDSERELMMIIWHAGTPVTRSEIEQQMNTERKLSATTILSFLSRLEEKGFLKVYKKGKNNVYEAVVSEQEYLQQESSFIFNRLYHGSLKKFVSALSDGGNLTAQDIEELQEFLEQKKIQSDKKQK